MTLNIKPFINHLNVGWYCVSMYDTRHKVNLVKNIMDENMVGYIEHKINSSFWYASIYFTPSSKVQNILQLERILFKRNKRDWDIIRVNQKLKNMVEEYGSITDTLLIRHRIPLRKFFVFDPSTVDEEIQEIINNCNVSFDSDGDVYLDNTLFAILKLTGKRLKRITQ